MYCFHTQGLTNAMADYTGALRLRSSKMVFSRKCVPSCIDSKIVVTCSACRYNRGSEKICPAVQCIVCLCKVAHDGVQYVRS